MTTDDDRSPLRVSPKRLGAIVVGLTISAVFIWLAFRKTSIHDVITAMAGVSIWWLAASQLTKLGGFFCMTVRSLSLLRSVHRFTFPQMFRSVLVAFAGNVVLPFRSGDLLRAGYLGRLSNADPVAYIGVVAFERLLDTLMLLIVFLLVVPSLMGEPAVTASVPSLAGGIVFALAVVLGVSRYPEIFVNLVERAAGVFGERISSFVVARSRAFASGVSAVASVKTLVGVTLVTAIYWGFAAGSVAMWIAAFDLELPWYAPLVVLAMTAFGTALPASPGFVGTYHYFCALALKLLGVGAATAASFALVGHATAMLPAAILSMIVLGFDWFRYGAAAFELGDSPSGQTSTRET